MVVYLLSLAINNLIQVTPTSTDAAQAVVNSPKVISSFVTTLETLFSGVPQSYAFFMYFAMTFIVCISFKFLIDFLKIVFSLIFNKGGI